MTETPAVREAAASLWAVDPGLPRVIGWRAAAELGREPILPVLSVPSGRWLPPDREALGDETVALVVLDGLLVADTAPDRVLGPGDVVFPWDPAVRWTACTPLRLAVLGTRFSVALAAWPAAAARLFARASAGSAPAAHGAAADRVLALLWRIAARWGTTHGDAVALPRALDVRAVSALLALPEADVTLAMGEAMSDGALVGRGGPGWLLRVGGTTHVTSGHSRARRDQLRARGAEQLALARAIGAEHDAVVQQLRVTREGSTRAGGGAAGIDGQDLMEA
jgi:hypothetical protein